MVEKTGIPEPDKDSAPRLHAVGTRVEHMGWPASRLQLGYAVLATVVSA